MAESSFDIVSRVDLQEVSNAVDQAMKEIKQRYDFKGSKSSIEFNRDSAELTIASDDDYKLKSVVDVLQTKLVGRKVSLKSLQYGKIEQASGGTVRQVVKLQQGISQDRAKNIVKLIKDTKLKLKEKDFDFHIEFVNYR
jgi:uncharacterized protein YajQ (UPF0234 family)